MADIPRSLGRRPSLLPTVAVLFAAAFRPTVADAQEEPSRRIPVVTSRFLPEARALLADSGFVNVEVARSFVDDMPADVVIQQFPTPTAPTAAVANFPPPSYPVSTEILLVVVEPLPRLPDLTGWRADRAMQHVSGLAGDLIPVLDVPQVDPAQRVVTEQSPPPGPVQPPDSVVLGTAPVAQGPANPPSTDTVIVADTVMVDAATGEDDTLPGPGVVSEGGAGTGEVEPGFGAVQVVVGGTALALAGLWLGVLGCRTLGPGPGATSGIGGSGGPGRRSRRRPDPHGDEAPGDDDSGQEDSGSEDAENEDAENEDAGNEDGSRETELPSFSPVIVDEVVWGSGGRVLPRDDPEEEPS